MLLWMFTTAFAHIALEAPPPRYPSDGSANNKACPCGVGDSNRLCDDPADRSDPDRDEDRASTFEVGETIILRFRETIGHAGRYRVAFDLDGADLDDFNDAILLDVEDPSGSRGNVGRGDLWELEVTLPDTPCVNCTLQLLQMMDGNTTDPVADPTGRSSYYQCADLVLTARPDSGTPPDTARPTASTDAPLPGPDEAIAGCGCTSLPTGESGGLALTGLLLLVRRRRRGAAR